MSLADLEKKYLSDDAAIHEQDTGLEVLIDGKDYFASIYDAINETSGKDDLIYILSWAFDPSLTLVSGAKTLGQLLIEKKNAGVDVRVLVDVTQGKGFIFPTIINGNYKATGDMRDQGLSNVLVDDNAETSGSHHEKVNLIRAGGNLIAFIGGIDFGWNRVDDPGHQAIQVDPATNTCTSCNKSVSNWHDIGVKVSGAAAYDAWTYFVLRWNTCVMNCSQLKHFSLPPAGRTARDFDGFYSSSEAQNDMYGSYGNKAFSGYYYVPEGLAAINLNEQPLGSGGPPIEASGLSVQVALSVSAPKVDDYWRKLDPAPPDLPNEGKGIAEISDVLIKAINGAQKYIYIEDQGLNFDTSWVPFWDKTGKQAHAILYPLIRNALQNGVKVIFVSSAVADPADQVKGQLNSRLNNEIQQQIIQPLTTGGDFVSDVNGNPALSNFVFYRVNCLTVHSKLVIVDDEFLSVGSANFCDRSMIGLDSEVNVAAVCDNSGSFNSASTKARDTRIRLWVEHLGLPLPYPLPATLDATQSQLVQDLSDIDNALAIWTPSWLKDPGFHFSFEKPGLPPGSRLTLVYP